ncbi:MAG TPA: hypothetical protein VMM76_02300 [Pirellulaceae bacterium]|nr:hypothetical protein [Pirellulaceae bacterium]
MLCLRARFWPVVCELACDLRGSIVIYRGVLTITLPKIEQAQSSKDQGVALTVEPAIRGTSDEPIRETQAADG